MKKITSFLLAVLIMGCFGMVAKTNKRSGKKKYVTSSNKSAIAEIIIDSDEPPLRLMANGTIKNFLEGQYYILDGIYYIIGIPYHWGYTLGIIKDDYYYLIVFEDPDFWEYMDSQTGHTSIKKLVESNLINYNRENDSFYYITSEDIKTINLKSSDIQKFKVKWFK